MESEPPLNLAISRLASFSVLRISISGHTSHSDINFKNLGHASKRKLNILVLLKFLYFFNMREVGNESMTSMFMQHIKNNE